MNGNFNNILFATDLSVNCRHAFTYAANLASRYRGRITLLHVMESVPESMDSRLKTLLGKDQWEMLQSKHQHQARASLIGKKSTLATIHQALDSFSDPAQNDDGQYAVENILIKEGRVVKLILETAQEEASDLILIGSNKTMFTEANSLGRRTKSLLKQSRIPVMIVPPADE
ncbi:MAG: universal stress protein [Desulfobacterium sp.]|nr:universal stress protein [Desulfobacterium sp.]